FSARAEVFPCLAAPVLGQQALLRACGGISTTAPAEEFPSQCRTSGTVDIGALKTKILETVRDINLADNTVDGEDDE
ncbi:hypothetical protein, partial [Corynebacterium sp. HMSC072G08]|uniref:hypothetical protein n=1 Tax=Corynebacterium sp. HMSC072G08 TaxID=1715039 RepID=UPI001AEF783F